MKQPMKSRDVLPKNVPGVGWVEWGGMCNTGVGLGGSYRDGVGHVGVGWGGSYRGGVGHIQNNLVIEANHHYLHTSPPWQLLGITGGAKFNYNHTLKCVKLRLGSFYIVYQKGDLVKQPMKSRGVLPKNVPGVGWGGVESMLWT